MFIESSRDNQGIEVPFSQSIRKPTRPPLPSYQVRSDLKIQNKHIDSFGLQANKSPPFDAVLNLLNKI